MSFLPEDDEAYLVHKGVAFTQRMERPPEGGEDRKAVIFPTFAFEGHLFSFKEGVLTPISICELLVLVPSGYSTTKLDSFYTRPRLHRADGTLPVNTSSDTNMFGSSWQFWSRHLQPEEWRPGIDGIDTYLQYIRAELRKA